MLKPIREGTAVVIDMLSLAGAPECPSQGARSQAGRTGCASEANHTVTVLIKAKTCPRTPAAPSTSVGGASGLHTDDKEGARSSVVLAGYFARYRCKVMHRAWRGRGE